MPKAPSSIPDVKADPYEKPSSSKQKASGAKGVSWTEDMDKQVIRHVLTKSDINLRYDFNELQKTAFPHLTPTQIRSRWDCKLKNALFPPEVLKMGKNAKGGKDGSTKTESGE